MAIEDNIPNLINIPSSLIGRHESSDISPMSFAAFSTNMKSDIAPMSVNISQTRLSSLFSRNLLPLTGRHEMSTTKPQQSVLGANNDNSVIAPITLSAPDLKSLFEIKIQGLLDGRHETSDTVPINSILGANNQLSATAPINSILGANNQTSATAPITSTLTGRFDTSSVAPLVSQLSGRFESSATVPVISTLTGRFESSDIDSSPTSPGGRFESSDIDSSPTSPGGRHESSDIDSSLTSPGGRFESSDIDTTAGVNFLDDSFATGFTTTQTPNGDFTPAGLEYSPYPGVPAPGLSDGRHLSSGVDDAPTTQDGRHFPGPPPPQPTIDITSGVDFFGFNTDAPGFTIQNSLLDSQYQGISGADYTYPDSQGLGFGILGTPPVLDGRHESSGIDTTAGVDFLNNLDATGFTTQNSLLTSQYQGISGPSYTYPDSQGFGFGILGTPSALDGRNESSNFSKEPGVNFLDIPNLDSQGFTINFGTGDASQFKGIAGQTYTHPDNYGLGIGTIGNNLFTNIYPTPYTTPIFPDGFTQNQPIEDSQFSIDSFAGGGKIGLTTEFTHATFGGVQGQVPIMGNNPTGLGSFLQGGATSGDMGVIDAFDDLAGGTKGFSIHDPSIGSERFTDGAAGGAIIGSSLNAEYKHRTPVPGFTYGNLTPANSGTGLAASITQDTTAGVGSGEAGTTFGAIGVINAFDDDKSGAKGFTAKMFDLGLPKTQFNGVEGLPGALTYEYPVDVGPAGEGRLMYNMPFSDAGNPYGGLYSSQLAKQIPVNPEITINNNVGSDPILFDFYKADPDRLHFSEDNKYQLSLGNFAADIVLNGSHPKSILADFAAREHSPSPLDSMEVLIPSNTGPTGEPADSSIYTTVFGYPNYQTQNLSYSQAGVANQRQGFVRNELFTRDIDYNTDGTYGHDLQFGGTGDDPTGLKTYKKPHIIRDMDSNWGLGGMAFDEGAFRGGFLTLTNRALQDVVRNVKHIIEDPIKGLLWGLKQIGLQASNPRVETEMVFLGRRTRVFNLGIGLIANMLTGPFGVKLYRHGILNGIGEDNATYERAVNAHGGINPYDPTRAEYTPAVIGTGKGGGNRLSMLKDELLMFGGEDIVKTTLAMSGLPYSYKGEPIDLLSGIAGPKSLYGIGRTRIRRWEKTDQHLTGNDISENIPDTVGGGRSSLLAQYAAASHFTLYNEAEKMDAGSTSFNDFRKQVYDNSETANDMKFLGDTESTPYEEFNREAKFGYSPYAPDRNRDMFNVSPLAGTSLADPYNLNEDFDEDYGSGEVDERENGMRDMIKLVVEDVHTSKKVRFRSYVTDITDTITPSWSATAYVGRPDAVHSFQNTGRSLSFTLMMAAQSRDGMKGMYRKLNYLYGLCYPHLGNGEPEDAIKEAMLAPYVKLTMGDWLYKCPGFFSEMTTTIDNAYPWEINLEKEVEVGQLPHMVSISLGYTVIGDGPHISAIKSDNLAAISGRHIGGGVNDLVAAGKFFEDLSIPNKAEA